MAVTKFKVNVAGLLEAIKERRALAVAEHEEKVAAYPALLEEWKRTAMATLREWQDAVEIGTSPNVHGYGSFPTRPQTPVLNLVTYDRDIAALSMASEQTITISAEDYGRYLA